ncbi:MAG: amidohydrolase [Ruminococcaceae bacterium]|nr:amidohydrolase [Oscillospiraceae bacterium]
MFKWKEIPKIDAHIHLLPDDVIEANRGYGDVFVDYGSLSDYLNIMDKYNIESSFIMPFNDPYMLSMDFNVETVHFNLKKMVSCAPTRLRCFADVDIRNNIDQTITELENTLFQSEFVGIKLHPTNTGYPIDGIYYDGIFQYASDNGVLVEIHSYPREHLKDDVCSPRRINNVLSKYPRLKVSIAHLGGFQYEELYGFNAYFNISSVLPDIVKRFGIGEANKILRSIGVDRLIFATDYPDSRSLKPTEIYETYFEILDKMDFTFEEAEKICRYNVLKWKG